LILKVNIDGLGVYKMLLFHPRKSKKAVSLSSRSQNIFNSISKLHPTEKDTMDERLVTRDDLQPIANMRSVSILVVKEWP
jgi:hypothetical protein